MSLTLKQKRFVQEYCVDFNATQAAIRAGYSPSTAYSIGSENLRKPEIKAAVQATQAAAITDIKITRNYLVEQANDIMLKAKANRAWSAARGANELLAKLTGHIVERRDLRVIRSFDDLTEEELQALVDSEPKSPSLGPHRH
jgi:phage terminase small subunit